MGFTAGAIAATVQQARHRRVVMDPATDPADLQAEWDATNLWLGAAIGMGVAAATSTTLAFTVRW